MQQLSIQAHFLFLVPDLQSPVHKHIRLRQASRLFQTPADHPDPCQQFIHRKRLGQIVICTQVQRLDLVRRLASGRQNQDR